jgi:hypothetical protein
LGIRKLQSKFFSIFLGDRQVVGCADGLTVCHRPTKFIKSSAGQELQKRLWKETVEEMATLTELPSAFV